MSSHQVWDEGMKITRTARENILRLLYRDDELSAGELRELIGLQRIYEDNHHFDYLEEWGFLKVNQHGINISENRYILTDQGEEVVETEILTNKNRE